MKKTTSIKGKSTNKVAKTPARKTTVTAKSTYTPISNNIYHDGSSYRVRVSVNGTKYSKNFSSKKKAYAFRKELLSAQ